MISWFLVLSPCETFHNSDWHHLTSSEHWEQQESTVSPLDRTGLNIECEILIEEEERTSFFEAWCGNSDHGGGVDDVDGDHGGVDDVDGDHGGGVVDVDGDHGGGFGDKMIFSKQL